MPNHYIVAVQMCIQIPAPHRDAFKDWCTARRMSMSAVVEGWVYNCLEDKLRPYFPKQSPVKEDMCQMGLWMNEKIHDGFSLYSKRTGFSKSAIVRGWIYCRDHVGIWLPLAGKISTN